MVHVRKRDPNGVGAHYCRAVSDNQASQTALLIKPVIIGGIIISSYILLEIILVIILVEAWYYDLNSENTRVLLK